MAKVLPVLVFLIIATSTVFLFQSTKLKNVQLNDQSCMKQESVNEILIDKRFFAVDEQKVKTELKNKFICIEDVQIEKKFPATILVKIEVKEPVVKIEGTSSYATVDGNIISGNFEKPVLFLSSGTKSQPITKLTDPTVLYSLQLASLIAKTDFTPTTIRITSDKEIVVYDHQGTIAIFTTQKTPQIQVDSLQQVLAIAKIGSSKIAKIDLRFDKPFVLYKNSQ